MLSLNFTLRGILFVCFVDAHSPIDIEFLGPNFADIQHAFLFPSTSSSDTYVIIVITNVILDRSFYSDVNMALASVKMSRAYFQLLDKYFINILVRVLVLRFFSVDNYTHPTRNSSQCCNHT